MENTNTVTDLTETDTEKTVDLMKSVNDQKGSEFIASGAYGCGYKNLSTSQLTLPRDEKTEIISELLKCMPPTSSPPDGLEKTHIEFMNKIQFIELNTPPSRIGEEPDFTEHRIVKETQYGETIKSIPNYYMYFAPILSSCPMDVAVLSTKDRMKCELFREMSTPSFREKDKTERLYVNSKVQFVEGSAPSKYFKKILWNDLPYEEDETMRQRLSPFFVIRFIRSYRHLLKAVRLLQGGSTPNNVIIHHDLKDGNIMFDAKRGVPIIIDFGISFDWSVFEESTHPKKLGDVFYRYFNKYTPWSIDVVIMAYVAKVALLKNGEGDDSIKEIYEKEAIAVDELKKVCDDFLENNEILKWVDTLKGGNANANSIINANAVGSAASAIANDSDDRIFRKENEVQTEGIIGNIPKFMFGQKKDATLQTGSLNGSVESTNKVTRVESVTEVTEVENMEDLELNSTRNKMKTQWYSYMESFNGKVWKDLVMDLSKRYASWDVYSLSVCYLQYIHQLELLSGKYQVPDVFVEFVEELKNVFNKT